MTIRAARPDDAAGIRAIYAPVVADSVSSFEYVEPSVEEMRRRIETTLQDLPWLVHTDADGAIDGYVYAGRHRERAAYQWSVDTSAYIRAEARGRGIGKRLYLALFEELVRLGYFQAFAGIALPNAASVGLHESVGFQPIGIYRSVGYKKGAWHDVGWWQKRLQPQATPATPQRFVAR